MTRTAWIRTRAPRLVTVNWLRHAHTATQTYTHNHASVLLPRGWIVCFPTDTIGQGHMSARLLIARAYSPWRLPTHIPVILHILWLTPTPQTHTHFHVHVPEGTGARKHTSNPPGHPRHTHTHSHTHTHTHTHTSRSTGTHRHEQGLRL